MQQLSHLTDAQLITAYIYGREQALELLVTRHKDKIFTTIYLLVKDRNLAEDLFQDTFLKIIKTFREKKYNEQGKFLPWASRIAHNICMDHFRKAKPERPLFWENGEQIHDLFHLSSESEGLRYERRQEQTSVRQLVEELPEEQREVIVLRLYADLSFKEIAALTGVCINTSLGRMRYALINLKKMIVKNELELR
jgi:RNA polymerase sigma-70 factor (ECF subfamily)